MKGNGCADASRIDASGRQQEPLNSQHTPGPWSWSGYPGDLYEVWSLEGPDGGILFHEAAWPISAADRALIVAAPNMLGALKVLVTLLLRDQPAGGLNESTRKAAMALVQETISQATKAEGA